MPFKENKSVGCFAFFSSRSANRKLVYEQNATESCLNHYELLRSCLLKSCSSGSASKTRLFFHNGAGASQATRTQLSGNRTLGVDIAQHSARVPRMRGARGIGSLIRLEATSHRSEMCITSPLFARVRNETIERLRQVSQSASIVDDCSKALDTGFVRSVDGREATGEMDACAR